MQIRTLQKNRYKKNKSSSSAVCNNTIIPLRLVYICNNITYFMIGNSLAMRIRPTILLFGDSITEFGFGVDGNIGWASLLSSKYSRRADVLNRGFSGYNSKHALDVLPSVLGSPNSADNAKVPLIFCTVFFGANDCSLPSARQYLDIDSYDKNIRSIVSTIRR
jgi:lysophospholipase L1-like esterase